MRVLVTSAGCAILSCGDPMITALIYWLVLVIIVALLYWVLAQFAPPQIMKIVLIVCVVIIVLSLIFTFLPIAGIHVPR